MTKEEKKQKIELKRAAKKAKREAKKAARIEKQNKIREAKRLKREAKKAKRLARLEKEKAKKLALREKKREAKRIMREKLLAAKAKTAANHANDTVDIKKAAKTMKLALKQIANEMSQYDAEKRAKKAKSIKWMGYDVETNATDIVVKFVLEKSKKHHETKPTIEPSLDDAIDNAMQQPPEIDDNAPISNNVEVVEPAVEMVPAGDLYGTNGNAEVANIESDDESLIDDDEDDEDYIDDSRDETDEDLIANRREFFSTYGDDFEPSDD